MPMLPASNFILYFSISLYADFVQASNLLAIFVSIWQSKFLPMFLFVTDTKPNFSWRFFVGPRFTKTLYVLVNPKVSDENFHFIVFTKIPLGLSIYQVALPILLNIFKVTLVHSNQLSITLHNYNL
jgi:hypothetical protein